jgi:hypothetical protein
MTYHCCACKRFIETERQGNETPLRLKLLQCTAWCIFDIQQKRGKEETLNSQSVKRERAVVPNRERWKRKEKNVRLAYSVHVRVPVPYFTWIIREKKI